MRVLLFAVVLALLPVDTFAQQGMAITPPLRAAELVADCMTEKMGNALLRPAWVEERESNYRVVTALRGQPEASRNVQSPPPATDTFAWADFYYYEDLSQAPPDNYIYDRRVGYGEKGYTWRNGGYQWFGVEGPVHTCLVGALGLW